MAVLDLQDLSPQAKRLEAVKRAMRLDRPRSVDTLSVDVVTVGDRSDRRHASGGGGRLGGARAARRGKTPTARLMRAQATSTSWR